VFVVAAIAFALLTDLYALWLVFHLGGPRATTIVDDLGTVAAAATGAVLTGMRAVAGGPRRRGWLLLCAALTALALGEIMYAWYEIVADRPTPFPPAADVAYLAGTVLLVAAVLFLGGQTTSRLSAVLYGCIITSAILLLSWLTSLHSVYEAGGSSLLSFALSLAYPIGDMVTIVIVLSIAARVPRLDPALMLVGGAAVVFAVSDSAFAYLTALGVYEGSHLLDVGYVAGYLLAALAAVVPFAARAEAGEEAVVARWQALLPYVPLGLDCTLVAARLVGGGGLDSLTWAALVAVIAFVLVRQLIAVIDSQSLAMRLRSASAVREILIGLVETEQRMATLGDLVSRLEPAWDAARILGRLMEGLPSQPDDDVTLLVLRRLARVETAGLEPAAAQLGRV